jgi:dTDP-4-dehydrorhamnose 3,5-epimerase
LEVRKINKGLNSCGLEIEETPLEGCFILKFPEHHDERGIFYRKYCEEDFISNGLNTLWLQSNFSSNKKAGTLRGFHYQKAPFTEIKLVTCVSGIVFDAILDLRPNSRTYLKTFETVLESNSNKSIYIAKGVAHAYLSLVDNSAVTYQVSEKYSKEYTSGVLYSDPKVKVSWPIAPTVVSEIDLSWNLL